VQNESENEELVRVKKEVEKFSEEIERLKKENTKLSEENESLKLSQTKVVEEIKNLKLEIVQKLESEKLSVEKAKNAELICQHLQDSLALKNDQLQKMKEELVQKSEEVVQKLEFQKDSESKLAAVEAENKLLKSTVKDVAKELQQLRMELRQKSSDILITDNNSQLVSTSTQSQGTTSDTELLIDQSEIKQLGNNSSEDLEITTPQGRNFYERLWDIVLSFISFLRRLLWGN